MLMLMVYPLILERMLARLSHAVLLRYLQRMLRVLMLMSCIC
jgi:hypothetical protein